MEIKLPDFGAIQHEVITELKERIIMRTPRDTGRAQEGWEANENEIYNNVPYIGFLEEGTSKMSPFYMVRTSLEELPDIIEKALERNKEQE